MKLVKKMFSDDSYHSESNFYYPNDLNSVENEPISASTIASDIQDLILSNHPENTMKKTRYDMNAWGRHFESENEQRNIENIPPEELNVYIFDEPSTLTCFLSYLNDQNSLINIYKDKAFNKAREVLS